MAENFRSGLLNIFAANVYSQNGEDGILGEILSRILPNQPLERERWCVEFGAWDGKHLSNTYNLVVQGWRAVFIEGDPTKFEDLLKTSNAHETIIPLCAYVEPNQQDPNSLDNLLKMTAIPKEFEVLSIDIDSYDLDVWESLSGYHPAVVIIEINSSAPVGTFWRHGGRLQGNTFSSTLAVGQQKGYSAVCHTGNLIFVRNDLLPLLGLNGSLLAHPELLFMDDWLILSGDISIERVLRSSFRKIQALLLRPWKKIRTPK